MGVREKQREDVDTSRHDEIQPGFTGATSLETHPIVMALRQEISNLRRRNVDEVEDLRMENDEMRSLYKCGDIGKIPTHHDTDAEEVYENVISSTMYYHTIVNLLQEFEKYELKHIPQEEKEFENYARVNLLSKLASTKRLRQHHTIIQKIVSKLSEEEIDVSANEIVNKEWMVPIRQFLKNGVLP
ncbi:hypothetical protein CR513_08097, partial [Mucuna pruriens]